MEYGTLLACIPSKSYYLSSVNPFSLFMLMQTAALEVKSCPSVTKVILSSSMPTICPLNSNFGSEMFVLKPLFDVILTTEKY